MINSYINIKSFSSWEKLGKTIADIDIKSTPLVVSGVKTKSDLQYYFLNQQQECLFGNSIQTFYEFLEDILFKVKPDIKIVSSHYVKAMIASKEDTYGETESIFEFLKLMLPAFSHPDGFEIMSGWLQTHRAHTKWSSTFKKANKIYTQILEENIITQEFIPALLFNLDLGDINIKKRYFYLGSNLKPVHIYILNSLAKNNNITLLCPSKNWIEKHEALKVYRELKVSNTSSLNKPQNKVVSKRFTSMLSEVKDAVAHARKWVEEGINQKDIVITAPDIDLYWQVLKEHLDIEGLGYDKATKAPIQSFSDVMTLISTIRANLTPSKNDLQLAIFNKDSFVSSYDEFYEKYNIVTELDDYKRSETVFNFISDGYKKENLSLEEFVEYIILIWEKIDGNSERLSKILSCLIQDNFAFQMDLSKWLYYLELLLTNITVTNKHPNLNGIGVLDLSSLDRLDIKKIYFMGATYQAMNSFKSVPITKQDLDKIELDTGFVLDHKTKNLEFNASWILSGNADVVVSFPESSFFSDELTPSYFWLKYAEGKLINQPEKTRWDLIQEKNAIEPEQSRVYDKYLIKKTLKRYNLQKLSATSIESYKKCPFILYAKKCLGLKDRATQDLDINFLYQGSLLHECLEELITEPFKNYSEKELEEYLKNKIKPNIVEPKYLEKFVHKYTRMLKRVFEFELKSREKDNIKTIGKEVEFKAHYLPDKDKFHKSGNETSILITGKIDRIDKVNDSSLRVVDYKSSGNKLKHHPSWIKDNLLQLILYSILVEEGFVDKISGKVSDALYFDLKGITPKGFYLDKKSNREGKISLEDLVELYNSFREVLKGAIEEIKKAEFDPVPNDPKGCEKCYLNKTCRYNYEM